ncbi:MAG: polyisoprenyl-teichoic acid--peptidoglycan teichoic acid transferase [Clostridiales bacterium]|nr:polyisoprenyl-teichoic acid--peptidoglycan teichoic acid transferase [Clostridiales bacterium]
MKKKIIISAIAMVILLIGGMAAGFYYEIKNNPQNVFEEPFNQPSSIVKARNEQDGGTVQMPTGKINIALLGLDKNAGRMEEYGDSFRTDTIMVFAIDFDTKKIDIISIPRDSYVKIAGKTYMDKINSAFLHGGGFDGDGFNTTLNTISSVLGNVPVNYYVAMDMDVVISLVDAIGGVYYDVEKDVRDGNGRLLLKAGYQKLNGKAFLYYVRDRHSTPGGDIDRVKRQQKILMALFDQMKSLKQLANLPDIYNSFKDKMYTNLNVTQIAALALFASDLDLNNVNTHLMPGDYLDMNGISYWGIDENKRVAMLKQVFGIDVEPNMRYDVYVIKNQYKSTIKENNDSNENSDASDDSDKPSKPSKPSSGQGKSPGMQQPSDEGPAEEPPVEQPQSDDNEVEEPPAEQPQPDNNEVEEPPAEQPQPDNGQSETN